MLAYDKSSEVSKQNQCILFESIGSQKEPTSENGEVTRSWDADSASPLINQIIANPDPESEEKNRQKNHYFGGSIQIQVFCLLLALSVVAILILLHVWAPIAALRFPFWKFSTSREVINKGLQVPGPTIFCNYGGAQITPNPENPILSAQSEPAFYSWIPSDVRINSFKDFTQIKETTTVLIIDSLTDSPQQMINQSLTAKDKIQRVELRGPMSREGLEMVFKFFRSIQHLHVDVDRVNLSFTENPEIISTRELISITLQNSEKSKLFDWPIILVTPKLRKIRVVDAILTMENFNRLKKFIKAVQATLQEIEITRCFICELCDPNDLHDLETDSLEKITINKRRLNKHLDDEPSTTSTYRRYTQVTSTTHDLSKSTSWGLPTNRASKSKIYQICIVMMALLRLNN